MHTFKNLVILSALVCFLGYIRYSYQVTSRNSEVHESEVSEKDKLISEMEKQNDLLIEELEEEKEKNQRLEGELTTCKAERQLVVEYYNN